MELSQNHLLVCPIKPPSGSVLWDGAETSYYLPWLGIVLGSPSIECLMVTDQTSLKQLSLN